MNCSDDKEVFPDVNLHLWQQRNFSNSVENENKFIKVNKQINNVAQIYFALNNQEITQSFGNTLLRDELKYFFEQNICKGVNFEEDKLGSIFTENSTNIQYGSKFTTSSTFQLDCLNDLLSFESKTEQLWLQEVQNKPSVSLSRKSVCPDPENQSSTQGFRQKTGFSNLTKSSYSAVTQSNQREIKRKFEDVQRASDEETSSSVTYFKSAREQLVINQKKKFQRASPQGTSLQKSLGCRPRNQCFAKFIPPSSKENKEDNRGSMLLDKNNQYQLKTEKSNDDACPKLKGIDPQLIELVMNEIMDHGPPIEWNHIAGLEFAKATIKEIVIWPMLRPDIFTGLRGPPKGILLFGPPGTGKTLIGKCIANQSGATFFSISASSLTSKWIGQAEKMVRALFAVASLHQPAVIFIDEIDSLLSQRSDSEHESSRRIKTEFFVQLDGATTSSEDRILVVGATNRPQEIDEAARRRLVKRLYIPLPDANARKQIIAMLIAQQSCDLSEENISEIVIKTDGYSGADVTNLCKDAALGPIRSLQIKDISTIHKDEVRPINMQDFLKALQRVKASVSQSDLVQYEEWNKIYGCETF